MTQTQDTLTKYGTAFQNKVLASLTVDKRFLEQTFDIVSPKYFDTPSGQWIARVILDYFKDYRQLTTMEVFKQETKKMNDDVLRVATVEHLRNVYGHVSDTDLQYVKDEFLTFCKNQALKNAILGSVGHLEKGDYDKIRPTLDKALQAGQERNPGHIWKTDMARRISDTARTTISTPWKVINQLMDGGLAAGELGVIAAPSSVGKSWFLAAIGSASMKAGQKVLHFTLELNEDYVGLRYDTVFSGIEPKEIKNNVERVKKIVDGIKGQLIIKYFPTRLVSSNGVLAHIQQLKIALDYQPDLLLIDYADLMRSSERQDTRYQELGAIYEELRGLAGELAIPCWTASQTQRSSIQDDVILADKIAESYGKIMTADFVMSLSRKLDDKLTHTGRVHIIKNRFGPDGLTFPAHMNISEGIFDILDPTSPEGMRLQQQMENDDTVKNMLLQKLRQLEGD